MDLEQLEQNKAIADFLDLYNKACCYNCRYCTYFGGYAHCVKHNRVTHLFVYVVNLKEMITFENFEKLLATAQEFDVEIGRWGDFGLPIFETPLYDIYWKTFNTAIDTIFSAEGKDWIDWWLFERISIIDGSINKCWDKDGNEIPVNTIADLWELIKEYRL